MSLLQDVGAVFAIIGGLICLLKFCMEVPMLILKTREQDGHLLLLVSCEQSDLKTKITKIRPIGFKIARCREYSPGIVKDYPSESEFSSVAPVGLSTPLFDPLGQRLIFELKSSSRRSISAKRLWFIVSWSLWRFPVIKLSSAKRN